MRAGIFSVRNRKEILRDPINLAFGLGFPLVLLVLMRAIQSNIPVELFELTSLTPGIAVFGLSFLTLFSAALIARDRTGSLLQRLFTTPMTAGDYLLGYMLPILPMAVGQSLICYLAAVFMGMELSVSILAAVVCSLPISFVFIGLGLLCGSLLNDKQAGGICGALLTNLTAWLSGAWFDLNLIGGPFKAAADVLPFVHSVEMERAALRGDYAGIVPHLWWVLGYGILILILAAAVFTGKMKEK